MEFLKSHYEKVILSVVLLGLAAAGVLLLTWVGEEKRALEDAGRQGFQPAPKELKPLDLTTNVAALERLSKPADLVLAGEHNLFNPVPWREMPDGRLIPVRTGDEIGPGALTITRPPMPLHLRIELDSVNATSAPPQYRFRVTREAAETSRERAPIVFLASSIGSKNAVFTLKRIEPRDSPTRFVLELADKSDEIVVTKESPYIEVSGYMVDLRYEPEKSSFTARRVGDNLHFNNGNYKIIAITETNVTVRAPSHKQTTIAFKHVPTQ